MALTKRELRWLNSLDPVALLGWTWFLEMLEHLFDAPTMELDDHEWKRQQMADAIEDHEHVVRLTSWPRRKLWDPDRLPLQEHKISQLSTNAALVVLRHITNTEWIWTWESKTLSPVKDVEFTFDLAPHTLTRDEAEHYDHLRGIVADCLAGTQLIEADEEPDPDTDETEDGEITVTSTVSEEDLDKATQLLGMYMHLLDVSDDDLAWLLAVSLVHGNRGGNDSATRRFHKMMEANLKALGKEKPLPISGDWDEDNNAPFTKDTFITNFNIPEEISLKRHSLLHGFDLRAMWIKTKWGGWGPVGELKRLCRDFVKHIDTLDPIVDKVRHHVYYPGIRVEAWPNNDMMVQIEVDWPTFAKFWATATWSGGRRKEHLRNEHVFWAYNNIVNHRVWGNKSLQKCKACLSNAPGFTRQIIHTKESLWSMVDLVTTLSQMKFGVLKLGPKSTWRADNKPYVIHVFRFKVFGYFVQKIRRRLGMPAFVPKPQPPTSKPMIEKPHTAPQWAVPSATRQD